MAKWIALACGALALAAGVPSLTAHAQGSAHYIEMKDGSLVVWPRESQHIALLVGNTTYRHPPSDDPNDSRLVDLPGACPGARAIAEALSQAGWAPADIVLLCDQNADQIHAAISRLIDNTPAGDSANRAVLLYFGGHGMEVAGANYLFGVTANPDLKLAGRLAWRSRQLFNTDAVYLDPILSAAFGDQMDAPFLVILDACRDNPVSDEIQTAYEEERRASGEGADDHALEISSAPTRSTRFPPPLGMQIFLATTHGASVRDAGDHGMSYVASALSEKIPEPISITTLMLKVAEKVTKLSTQNHDSEIQRPDPYGILATFPHDRIWCITPCVRAAQQIPAAARYPLFHISYAVNAQASPEFGGSTEPITRVGSRDELLYTAANHVYGETDLIVDWCADPQEGENNFRQASATAQRIAAVAADFRTERGGSIGRVRLVELSATSNAEPRNGFSGNGTLVDDVTITGAEPEASFASNLARRVLGLPQTTARQLERTPNNIRVFYCKTAHAVGQTSLLWVQVPHTSDLFEGSKMVDTLAAALGTVRVVRQVEAVDSHPYRSAEISPDRSDVRYYGGDARAREAKAAAEALKALLGHEVRVQDFSRKATPKNINTLEVWLGKDDADRLAQSSR